MSEERRNEPGRQRERTVGGGGKRKKRRVGGGGGGGGRAMGWEGKVGRNGMGSENDGSDRVKFWGQSALKIGQAMDGLLVRWKLKVKEKKEREKERQKREKMK